MSDQNNDGWLSRINSLLPGLQSDERQDIEDLLAENDLTGAMYMAEQLNRVRYQADIDEYDVSQEANDAY